MGQDGIVYAKKKHKSEFAGIGCVIQGLGLVLLFFFPIGTIIGAVLLLVGSTMSIKLICSSCGNIVEKTAKICPTCKSNFSKPISEEEPGY